MNLKSILLFTFINIIILEVPHNHYLWPTNSSKTITTLFGEKRTERFHAGIDVRTYGRIGDELFAIEDGYISRIKVTSSGYGKAIYIKLNDGNTALYAHLDVFNEEIESVFKNLQIKKNNSYIDAFFNENQYPVKKGDLIGFCGDSGSISGPHLHFEIRDSNGNPVNPLTNYYTISDTLKPIAESIAFIPLDKNCFINGKQGYEVKKLKPLKYNGDSNFYKYFLEDTTSVIGNFGIALNTYDKIDASPFDFGIYEIQLIIDNKEVYKINFDQYSFKHDRLIYREIDYNLLVNESKAYHRLFLNHNSNLDFVSKDSNSGINLDKGFHNLIINVVDNYENKIQIQAIIKGDIVTPPKEKFNHDDLSITFNEPLENISFNLSTRIDNSIKIPAKYSIFDSVKYKFDIPQKPYEILEYSILKNGIKSKPTYISMLKYDPYKISGEFDIIHLDNNIMINFIEDLFTGYEATLLLEFHKTSKIRKINLKRFEKNILSSGLLNISDLHNIEKITINYQTNPEIIFTKDINGIAIKNNKHNYFSFNNFSIKTKSNSFYNDVFLSIKNNKTTVPKNYKVIHPPISLSPNNIPFKNKIMLSYLDNKSGGIFSYNSNSKKWIFIQDSKSDSLVSKISSGGIFAILNETKSPKIKNVFPSNNAKYELDDLKLISFNGIDNESGINSDSIKIYLNGNLQFYEYVRYRNLIRTSIDQSELKNHNKLQISVKDNLGNEKKYQGNFYINE